LDGVGVGEEELAAAVSLEGVEHVDFERGEGDLI